MTPLTIFINMFGRDNAIRFALQIFQISALALDPSGARLVTGSIDFDVKLWDFAGMDSSLKSFRSLRPCEWLSASFFLHELTYMDIYIYMYMSGQFFTLHYRNSVPLFFSVLIYLNSISS